MKQRKLVILFIALFAGVAMLISCTSYRQPNPTFTSIQAPQIATTMVEVTAQAEEKPVTLKIQFDAKTGKCKGFEVNGSKPKECNDREFVDEIKNTYYCTDPRIAKRSANTDINNDGTLDVYCGNVLFLTNGADIRFKAASEAGNKTCKNVGGYVICY